MFMTVTDIFLRNIFMIFLPGVFELTQFLLCMIVFCAAAYAQDNGAHVCIDVIYGVLPRVGKWVISLVSSIFFLAINIVMTYFVFQLALAQIERGDFTSSLEIPWWTVSMLASVGMFLFTLSVVCDLIFIIKDKGVLTIDAS